MGMCFDIIDRRTGKRPPGIKTHEGELTKIGGSDGAYMLINAAGGWDSYVIGPPWDRDFCIRPTDIPKAKAALRAQEWHDVAGLLEVIEADPNFCLGMG